MKEKFSLENKTREIEVADGIIVYTSKCDGVKDYVTYNDTVYQILTLNKLCPFRNDGRLKFNVFVKGSTTTFYLYDLVLAVEQRFIDRVDGFLSGLQKYYDWKRMNGLSVDHADNNIHNNTVLNLSLMDSIVNMSKSTLVARFRLPYILNTCYCGGKYRVMLSTGIGDQMRQKLEEQLRCMGLNICIQESTNTEISARMGFVCPTAEDFRDCLRMLIHTHYGWADVEATPAEHKKENTTAPCWTGDIHNSIRAQRELSTMSQDSFMIYKDGKTEIFNLCHG